MAEIAVHSYPANDPIADAAALHKAFTGLGTDEDAVINILAHRSKHQLEQIDHEYRVQSHNGTSLQHGLEKELSGSFKSLAVGIVTPVKEYKKRCLKDAVEGLGTRESTLIDVFCQSTNEEIHHIVKDADLYKKVLDDISGDFKRLIIQVARGERPNDTITPKEAEDIAQLFYKAGEGKIGTDEGKYIDVITKHSLHSLHQIDEVYKAKHKHGFSQGHRKRNFRRFETFSPCPIKAARRIPCGSFTSCHCRVRNRREDDNLCLLHFGKG